MSEILVLNGNGAGICIGGRFDGWLMKKHPDGQWVSVRKLERETPQVPSFLQPPDRRPAPDVEKVARALFRAQMISTRSWEETDEDIRESYRVNARAAIAAMAGR